MKFLQYDKEHHANLTTNIMLIIEDESFIPKTRNKARMLAFTTVIQYCAGSSIQNN